MRKRDTLIEYCARCGAPVHRFPSARKRSPRAFCSRACHMALLNKELNPTRMTEETREKLRQARLNTGEQKSYAKLYSRHEHRIIAERILGRQLKPDEVVHHIDGNKRNNAPENIMVFPNQSEHMRWHLANDPRYRRNGGDAHDLQALSPPAAGV